MKKLKLTDEELSRVLGQAAIGKLDHWNVYDPITECGCIGGAAMALFGGSTSSLGNEDNYRFWSISQGVEPFGRDVYPSYQEGPDAVLRYLEARGLA